MEETWNRQLQTWLSEEAYEKLEYEWQEQLELRSELKDKPSDLKRYEEKLKQATFNYNRAEGYSSKGKHSTAKKFYKKSETSQAFVNINDTSFITGILLLVLILSWIDYFLSY